MAITTAPRRARSGPLARRRARAAPTGAELAGTLALAGFVAAMALLALAAAAAPTSLLPTHRTMPHYFPGWLAGPLHGVGLVTSGGVRVGAALALCACYAVALRCAGALPARRLWGAIALAHLAAALAPPLLSADVFGYIGFARLAALHGLSPYAYTAAAAPHDAIHPLLGWTTVTTPYGPLFTLLSQALVPLGIAGGLWAFKAIAALTSLATVAVIWLLAQRLGRSPRGAIAFYGLNPLVILFAVAGAHNETLFGLLVAAGALALLTGRERAAGAAVALATAIKASAGLIAPFAVLGARRRGTSAGAFVATLAACAALGILAYGAHVLGIGSAWVTEQHQIAGHSIPSQVSKLLGLGQLAPGVRAAFMAMFGCVLAGTLWRAWRGAWWIDCYGWATLALLAATAWILPWYGLWALLPASISASRRLRTGALVACAYLIAIRILVSAPLSAG